MPKGQFGCWVCGEPTDRTLQAWLRDYTDARDACGNRRQKTVDAITRNLCEEHGLALYTQGVELFNDHVVARRYARGCATCGAPTTSRVQWWLRRFPSARSVESVARCFCEGCSSEVYGALWDLLDGGSYVPTPTSRGRDLAAPHLRLHHEPRDAAQDDGARRSVSPLEPERCTCGHVRGDHKSAGTRAAAADAALDVEQSSPVRGEA